MSSAAQGQPQQDQQAQTVARPYRWPLIIMPSNRQENTDKDARLVNGYMEKELGGDTWLYKRPGILRSSNPSGGSGLGQGVYNWQGDIYTIVNGHLFKNNSDKGGTIDTTNGVYTWSSVMGATPKVVFQNGIEAFCYDDTNGLQQITGNIANAAPWPYRKGWAYLDGTLYICQQNANIWCSDPANDDITTPAVWSPANGIVAYIEPNRAVALAKQLVYVVIFKETSTEIFYDQANPTGSPLGRVSGAKVNYGCISQDSVRQLDGALFWLCTNESAAVQVMRMDNLRPEIISTPAIERLLANADYTTVYSWTLKLEGHRWYAVTLVNNNLTLLYDVTTGLWSQWTDSNGNYLPFVDSTYKTSTAETLLQHATDGWLYTVSSNNFTDQGNRITLDIYTPNFDAGTSRFKTLQSLYFDTNQIAGSVLDVRYSDDDYQTWSDFRPVDLSLQKPMLVNLGSFKRRAFDLRHSKPTRFRMKAMDFQTDIGTL